MKLIKSTKGMTMVEIIVALSILGIVALGIMGFFTDSFKFQAKSQQVAYAQKLADQNFEYIKNQIENGHSIDGLTLSVGKIDDIQTIEIAGHNTDVTIKSCEEIEELEIYYITLEVPYGDVKGTINSSVTIDKNVIKDIKTIEITYSKGNAGDACKSIPLKRTVEEENTYFVDPFAPYVKGHKFEKWKASDGTTYQPGESFYVGTSDITFTAIWRCNCCEKEKYCTDCGVAPCGVSDPEKEKDGIYIHCKNTSCKNKCKCCRKCKTGCTCENYCKDCVICEICNYCDTVWHYYCNGKERIENHSTVEHDGHGCQITHHICICGDIDCDKGCTKCTVGICRACVVDGHQTHKYCNGNGEKINHTSTRHDGHGCNKTHVKCVCGYIDCDKNCTPCDVGNCTGCEVHGNHDYCNGDNKRINHTSTRHDGHGCDESHPTCACGYIECDKGCSRCTVGSCTGCTKHGGHDYCNGEHHKHGCSITHRCDTCGYVLPRHQKCPAGHEHCSKGCCSVCKKSPCTCSTSSSSSSSSGSSSSGSTSTSSGTSLNTTVTIKD